MTEMTQNPHKISEAEVTLGGTVQETGTDRHLGEFTIHVIILLGVAHAHHDIYSERKKITLRRTIIETVGCLGGHQPKSAQAILLANASSFLPSRLFSLPLLPTSG